MGKQVVGAPPPQEKQQQQQTLLGGTKTEYYYCNRSGYHDETDSKGIRAIKSQGTAKMDSYCTSKIVYTIVVQMVVWKLVLRRIIMDISLPLATYDYLSSSV